MTDLPTEFDSDVADLIAAVADDFRARRARGEDPAPEEYVARHPEAAGEIRGVLAVLGLAAPSGTAADSPAPLPVPTAGVLGDFRILREVGRGGMGVVYEAEQLSLGRRVALKVLPFAALADPRLLQRFKNEARAAAALDHPHVVKVHAVGEERGVHYIAMQFIDGRPLSELIRGAHDFSPTAPTAELSLGPAPTAASTTPVAQLSTLSDDPPGSRYRRAAEIGVQAAEALEHAHALGVVHRDVKPGNLLLDARGDVWVSDFGLAKVAAGDAGVTLTGDVFGTLRYMSPEQALAKHDLVDHRADVYALGATLYELLAGRPAVDALDRADILRQITDGDPIPLRRWDRSIPPDLETVILKCLRKEPNDRYASAKELADDLRRFLAGEPVRAKPIGPIGRATRWTARRPTLVLLVGLTALAVGVAIALGVRNHYRAEADRSALQTAAEREERQATELRATQDAVERQRFFALLEQVRQRRADPYPGWSGENLKVLRELAALPPATEYLHDLRTEAAAALSALDLVPAGTIGPDFQASNIDYSPDGRWLAASRWGTLVIRLYQADTGRVDRELQIKADAHAATWALRAGKADRIQAVRFSPDGYWFAAGTDSGRVALWDTRTWGPPRVWVAHADPADWQAVGVFTITFSSDGRGLTTGARTSFRTWSLDGTPASPLVRGYRLPCSLPSPDGPVPVTVVGERAMCLLDPGTDRIAAGSRRDGALPLAVHPGGRLMTFMPTDTQGAPLIHGPAPGAHPKSLRTATGIAVRMPLVEYMAFDPAGGVLITVEEHARRVKLWDVASSCLAAEQITRGDAVRAVFTPNGRQLAIAGRHGIALFEFPNRILETLAPVSEDRVESVCATADHSALRIVAQEESLPARVFEWQAGSGNAGLREVGVLPPAAGARATADWSPDGQRAVYSYGVPGVDRLCSTDGRVWEAPDLQSARFGGDGRLWILEHDRLCVAVPPTWSDRVVWRNDGNGGMVLRTLAVGRDSVFVGRRDGCVFRIVPSAGAPASWPLLKTPIAGLSLSPDETRLLVGGEGGEVRLVDPGTGAAVEIQDAHRGSVPGVAFGRHFFVTGSADRQVRLWTAEGRPLATFRMQGPVRKVLLSDDGRSLLVLVEGERAVRRWRLGDLFHEWRALGLGGDPPPV